MASRARSTEQYLRAFAWALVVCALPTAALARGEGIKAGPGRIHLGLDLDLVYDTNPGYQGDATKAGDLALRIRPGLTLDFPSDMVSLLFNARVGYDVFFGIEDERTKDYSAVVGEGGLAVGFNPKGVFAVFLEDQVSRTGDPRYTPHAGRLDRTDNEARLRFQIRPPGGALEFDLAYGFFLDWFDDDRQQGMRNYGHRCFFSGKWKFFPKTALVLDFDADLRRFPYSYTGVDGATHRNPDINAIRATAGMIGQITTSLSVIAKIGYGDTLLEGAGYAGADYRSAIAQAEVNFRLSTTYIGVGYQRGFQPVAFFAYYGQDRLYLRFQQQLFGKLNLGADFACDILAFGQRVDNAADTGRQDYFLSGGASVDYLILDWLGVGLAYQFQALLSGYDDPEFSTVEYDKHAVILNIKLDY